jgi:hypothetical protein
MADKFYVYEHWRPDTDLPFHVGKGHGNRAFRFKKNRNKHYLRIVKKLEKQGLCVEVKMVSVNLSEPLALTLEIERIAFWRAAGINLTNLTDGGEGVSGLKHSAETKQLLREISKRIMKKVMADPEIRAKISKAVTERMADPDNRLRQSKKMKQVMADDEMRQRISDGMTAVMSDPEVRESRRQSMITIMADPIKRAASAAVMTEFYSHTENREARRKSTAESWKDPEIAERRSDGIKKALAHPTEKARRSEQMRQRMADPVYAEKMSRINKARHQAARDAKAAAK